MKKAILPFLIFLIISIAACQPTKEVKEVPKGTTNGAAADSGSDLGSADDVEKDLDSSELNELDSGFDDVQSI